MKKIGYLLLTIALMCFGFGCICMTVHSQEKSSQEFEQRFYDEMEQEYKSEIRSVLEQAYCYNSGITMTHVTDAKGNRSYQLMIHHKHIDKMETVSRDELLQQLKAVKFADERCEIEIELYTYQNS